MSLFEFPNPVNEVAARSVAAGVLIMSAITLLLSTTAGHQWLWLSVVLTYGFLARALTGPTLSPLGQFATRIVAPRIGHPKPVAGPPKRFAQAMGSVITVAVVVLTALGLAAAAQVVLVLIIAAAAMESLLAFCIGCKVFAALMRLRLIPAETCEACSNITLRTL
jgi:hypothetical protein